MLDENFLNATIYTISKLDDISSIKRFVNHLSADKIKSKKWLLNNLSFLPKNVLILGSWFPTVIPYLLPNTKFTFVDVDPGVIEVSKKFLTFAIGNLNNYNFVTANAKTFISATQENYDLIINTSCEHMNFHMKDIIWNEFPLYAFQSNNYDISEHINIQNNLEEFKSNSGLTKIYYEGTLECKNYDRYMVIGKI